MHQLGSHADVTGDLGMLGRIALFHAEEATGIDLDGFGGVIYQDAPNLQIVLLMTWDLNMTILVMPTVIMGHILVDIATVKQDGMEVAATIVCIKCRIKKNYLYFYIH